MQGGVMVNTPKKSPASGSVRTTRRYDRAHMSLDRFATYSGASYLAAAS